ncbi:MAG: hypothetical protein KDD45_05160 [Bdellovibrionales bacterium]|nr:hypothetical protein [Bdellovibrionales bacterium]
MADSIKIMVRVRPFNQREKDLKSKCIVEMAGQQLRLINPADTNAEPRKFAFHRCYYSTDDAMGLPPVNNRDVFEDIGREILDQIYQGYNATIFAYGQTGSGKSYSIEGIKDVEKGLLQMCLEAIFQKKEENSKAGVATSVKVTYLEIYNEKLRDLLNADSNVEVKAIPIGGNVELRNVKYVTVNSYAEVLKEFEFGKTNRVVGATQMNKNSSRSHAIFTIYYKDKKYDSKFNIVDLAGS